MFLLCVAKTCRMMRSAIAIAIALAISSAAHAQTLVSPQFDAAVVALQRAPTAEQWLNLAYYLQHSDVTHYVEDGRKYHDSGTDLVIGHLLLKGGALVGNGELAAYECASVTGLANQGYPGDGIAAFDICRSNGALTANYPQLAALKEIIDRARTQVASDKASLAPAAVKFRGQGDGAKLANVGNAYLTYGDAVTAEQIYAEALQMAPKNPDLLLLELGMAQFDQGRLADSDATFLKVGGRQEPLARLWRVLIAIRR